MINGVLVHIPTCDCATPSQLPTLRGTASHALNGAPNQQQHCILDVKNILDLHLSNSTPCESCEPDIDIIVNA